ncbi:PIN domain-containing protein [Amycolatopsis sp. NPDC059657]|uniref:PIN domain-containing protein n=1 Tax=Amycolatopsis sp. NPDC059657 TaxID=3346899 RepID=UPI003672DFEC
MTGHRLILDAGALIHLERKPRGHVFTACRDVLATGKPPLLPTVVLAQVWRASPRQAPLATVRQMCRSVPFTDEVAEAAGRLLALSGTADVVDAAVVVTAISYGGVVLTSDPEDLTKLADAAGVSVPLVVV